MLNLKKKIDAFLAREAAFYLHAWVRRVIITLLLGSKCSLFLGLKYS